MVFSYHDVVVIINGQEIRVNSNLPMNLSVIVVLVGSYGGNGMVNQNWLEVNLAVNPFKL